MLPIKEYRIRTPLHKIKFKPSWKVVDIGSGHNPVRRADILIDSAIDEVNARIIVLDKKSFVVGDAQNIPLKSKSIDFVIARHVAEHLEDPALFCEELMRVAKEGYIETPGVLSDILLNEPYHIWRVRKSSNTIIFNRKKNFKSFIPLFYQLFYYGVKRQEQNTIKFENLILHYLFTTLRFVLITVYIFLPFTVTSYRWKGTINFQVIDNSKGKT